ncbi:MAG: UPF0175 family protein [Anaerolineales bacterium]|nr:UPF0175 family protein [Anaerolineales bacterium]
MMQNTMPWAFDQLQKLRQMRPELVENAMARLLGNEPELRWSLVIGAYQDGKISLGKAAEHLNMHELDLKTRFIELGIPLRIGPATLAEAQAEVQALNNWFDKLE